MLAKQESERDDRNMRKHCGQSPASSGSYGGSASENKHAHAPGKHGGSANAHHSTPSGRASTSASTRGERSAGSCGHGCTYYGWPWLYLPWLAMAVLTMAGYGCTYYGWLWLCLLWLYFLWQYLLRLCLLWLCLYLPFS